MHTTTGGSIWSATQLAVLVGVSGLAGISCPSAKVCEAVGATNLHPDATGVALRTVNAGATWHTQRVPAGVGALASVACSSTTRCEAVGAVASGDGGVILGTSNGGATWTKQTVLDSAKYGFSAVACPPSTQFCEAVGSGVAVGTTNDGRSWSEQAVPSGSDVSDVVCPSSLICDALGSDVLRTTDGGLVWKIQQSPAYFNGITCVSTDICEATSFHKVYRTTDGGVVWHGVALSHAPSFGSLTGVACASTSSCEAVGGSDDEYYAGAFAAGTTDSGASWKVQKVPAIVAYTGLSDVACVSSSSCWAVGFTAAGGGLILSFR
jgi:hypothetical protein